MMVGIIGIIVENVGENMKIRYVCLSCDFLKDRGTMFRGSKFICSDCDLMYWRENKKWSKDRRIYYANISAKSS